MRVSDLIEMLEELYENKGDREIKFCGRDQFGYWRTSKNVEIDLRDGEIFLTAVDEE